MHINEPNCNHNICPSASIPWGQDRSLTASPGCGPWGKRKLSGFPGNGEMGGSRNLRDSSEHVLFCLSSCFSGAMFKRDLRFETRLKNTCRRCGDEGFWCG